MRIKRMHGSSLLLIGSLLIVPDLVSGEMNAEWMKGSPKHRDTAPNINYNSRQVSITAGQNHISATVYECGISATRSNKIQLTPFGNLYKLSVPLRSQYSFVLPNKTAVFLNSGSTFIFSSTDNYIELSGEGYLQIGSNNTIIYCGKKIFIRADSGSSCNIIAYKDYSFEPWLQATLINGPPIKLSSEEESVILSRPGNQLLIVKDFQERNMNNQDTAEVVCWTKQRFHYKNIDPYFLIARIARWHGIAAEFHYSGPRKVIGFSGNYQSSLRQAINAFLNVTTDYSFFTEEDRLTISKTHGVR